MSDPACLFSENRIHCGLSDLFSLLQIGEVSDYYALGILCEFIGIYL
jgi:hypothetical protein